ncbi:DUF6261 family protein [Capnocytophaga stomatis]|uniref:Uncharacterized protein n=1 Tax=Capnocytophaga stomatis TaxID=1848904 RepID=A0A250G2M1_9FLAO|nr:DUF6261 family protein [Capnocytophaga stomatis]ATA90437.1 hypothetical protein CGC58_12250 [Capnocytophaga stomatis]GIJ94114.1 hypothetical protein CAPN002_13320 [Capnocytophaga stomatis]
MKITLSKLNTKELATLTETTISISKSGKYTFVESNELLKQVEEIFKVYRTVYTKSTFSGKGKSVAEADRHRDKLYNGLRDYIKGYAGLEPLPHNAKAKTIYAVFKKYGTRLAKLKYAEQTAQLRKFLEEMNLPENLLLLEDLGVKAILDLLKQAQDDFDVIYAEQIASNSELRNIPSATKIRSELEEYLRAYFTFIKAMQKSPEWKPLYNEINELVKSIKPNSSEKKNNKPEEPQS